jgi:hypothetical protein
VQHVRAHEHRAAAVAEVAHEVDDVAALLRIEAVERLVEQQHLGVVGQGLGELDALAVALREHLHRPPVVGVEVDLLQRAARGRLGIGDAAQAREHRDEPQRRHERPQPVAVRQHAEPPVDRVLDPGVDAEDAHRAAIGRREAGQELEGGRLAGAVLAQQARDAGPEGERDLAQGDRGAVPLGRRLEDDLRLVHRADRR